MITFVLAEAALELMPPEMLAHPKVLARAKKRRRAPERLLLDQAVDHEAMRDARLPERDRRGRPDIAHVLLLLLQDSPLTQAGLTRVLVHTRHDELVRVRADTRIMRHQPKFVTLLEDLFRQGEVPEGDPLLTLERGRTLASILAEDASGAKVLLDESGRRARTLEFEALGRGYDDLTVVLGAFPRGPWRGLDPASGFDHVLRVADHPVSAWSALVPVLAGLEDARLASEDEEEGDDAEGGDDVEDADEAT